MSISSIHHTQQRIKDAPEESAIAVYRPTIEEAKSGFVRSAFANTFFTQQQIRNMPHQFIGIFHKGMPLDEATRKIRNAVIKTANQR